MEIVIAVVLGAAIGVAVTLFVAGIAGMFVAALRWGLTPPPPPPPADPCPTCTRLQALWDTGRLPDDPRIQRISPRPET